MDENGVDNDSHDFVASFQGGAAAATAAFIIAGLIVVAPVAPARVPGLQSVRSWSPC